MKFFFINLILNLNNNLMKKSVLLSEKILFKIFTLFIKIKQRLEVV